MEQKSSCCQMYRWRFYFFQKWKLSSSSGTAGLTLKAVPHFPLLISANFFHFMAYHGQQALSCNEIIFVFIGEYAGLLRTKPISCSFFQRAYL